MAFSEISAGPDTVHVELSDSRKLTCVVCGNDTFHERNSLLSTRGLTFFRLDWANQEATNFVRVKCGYIHWFLPDTR